eukprot:UN29279
MLNKPSSLFSTNTSCSAPTGNVYPTQQTGHGHASSYSHIPHHRLTPSPPPGSFSTSPPINQPHPPAFAQLRSTSMSEQGIQQPDSHDQTIPAPGLHQLRSAPLMGVTNSGSQKTQQPQGSLTTSVLQNYGSTPYSQPLSSSFTGSIPVGVTHQMIRAATLPRSNIARFHSRSEPIQWPNLPFRVSNPINYSANHGVNGQSSATVNNQNVNNKSANHPTV